MAASGIAVGINKGHIVTKRVLKAKPSNKIGVCILINKMDGWMDGLYICLFFFWVTTKSQKKSINFEKNNSMA